MFWVLLWVVLINRGAYNRIYHLVYCENVICQIETMENISYKENGEIRSFAKSRLKLPMKLDKEFILKSYQVVVHV